MFKIPVPRPDLTNEPRVVVEYTGGRLGTFSVRGRVGGVSYRFAATREQARLWVHLADAERFRLLSDFEVLDETTRDPPREREASRERRLADLESEVAELRLGRRRSPASKPRVRPDEALLCYHLAHHCPATWTTDELVATFIHRELNEPRKAINARQRRFAADSPALAEGGTACRYCREDFCPSPRDFADASGATTGM